MEAQQKGTSSSKAIPCEYDSDTYRDDFAGKLSYKFNEQGKYSKGKPSYQTDHRYKNQINTAYINTITDKTYNILEPGYKNNNGLLIDYDVAINHSIDNAKPFDKIVSYHLTTHTQHIFCKNGYKSASYLTTPFEIRFNSLWGEAELGTFYDKNKKDEIFFYNNNQVYSRVPPNKSFMGYEAWSIPNNNQIKEKIESVLIAPKGKPIFLSVPNKAHIEYKIKIVKNRIAERIKDIQSRPVTSWEQYQKDNEHRFKDRKNAYTKRNDLAAYDKFVEEEKKYWQKQVDAVNKPEEDMTVTKLKTYLKNAEDMLKNESASFLNAPCYFLADGEDTYISIKRSFYYTKETVPRNYSAHSEYVYYNPELFNTKDLIEKLRFAYIFIGPISTSTGIVGKADALLEKLQQKLFTEENIQKVAAMLE